MKKIGIILFALVLTGSATFAQNKTANSLTYKTAAGIKIWNGGALDLKTFLDDKNALEFIGFVYNHGTRLSALYEIHGDLNTETNLKWYIGPGAHVGFYNSKYAGDNTYVGIDGVICMDYQFKDLPLNLSLDWQPSFEFGSGEGFIGNYGGLAVRYTF